MALVVKDRVQETSVTTGTGTLTLAGAVVGFQTFSSAIGNTNTTYYAISMAGSSDFEVGIGTVGAGTLTRDTVLESSNANALVNFAAGTKNVFCTYPADKAVYLDESNVLSGVTITAGDGTGFTLQDDVDATKKAQFQLSGITTGTTRTYTLPNVSGTLAALNLAQTFTTTTTFSGSTVTVGTFSAGNSIYGLGTGATLSGSTKAINIGTAGVSGSTTNITVGSAVSGATTNININGVVTANDTITGAELLASNGLILNSNTVSANYTIPTNYNAVSVGTITINSGVTVTVPSGSNWKVL
jgi:hypothetical protein